MAPGILRKSRKAPPKNRAKKTRKAIAEEQRKRKATREQVRNAKNRKSRGTQRSVSKASPDSDSPTDVRRKYRKQLRQKPFRKFVRFTLFTATLTTAGAAGWYWLEDKLPTTTNIEIATKVRSGTITYTSLDGNTIYQSGPATRTNATFNEIPKQLKEAFIATEDRRFYEHDGVDLYGILRAVVTNISVGGLAEGGSTITQQLARISFLNQERSLLRKLKEARISQKIEASLSKDEILERYLNQVYLGSGAHGVADAAWVYFGKSLSELTLSEMATIAGMPAAPSQYSPLVNPEIAQERRDLVLYRMQQSNFITPAEKEAAQNAPLVTNPRMAPSSANDAPYFTAFIQAELEEILPQTTIAAGGLTITTTLNHEWQTEAAQTIKQAVEKSGPIYKFDQAALVSIDPSTGGIKTMVGGPDFEQSQFNRVTQAQRQPGSTFKVFVYTAAIAAGFPPSDGYLDAPIMVDGYRPKNYSGKYKGWVSMAEALTKSYNIPAVRVLIDVGFKPTLDLAKNLGIDSQLDAHYSMALGSEEVNLLEMTNAYSSIASQGTYFKPHGIHKVVGRGGEVLFEAPTQGKRVLDKDSASIMTWMLEDVVRMGTGQNAKLDRPVAGKTGTSEDYRDLWFIGYIPQVVTGVWMGNDDNHPTKGSSALAAQTWQTYMAKITQGMPVQAFPNVPRLTDRKGSIKAQPIQPKQMLTESIPENKKQEEKEEED